MVDTDRERDRPLDRGETEAHLRLSLETMQEVLNRLDTMENLLRVPSQQGVFNPPTTTNGATTTSLVYPTVSELRIPVGEQTYTCFLLQSNICHYAGLVNLNQTGPPASRQPVRYVLGALFMWVSVCLVAVFLWC